MPNHIKNRLVINATKEQIKEILDKYTTENRFPDFDKIISDPRCDEYNDIPNQEAVKNNSNWWYNWNITNWGVKWNSYNHNTIDFGIYQFDTAWNNVLNLMFELSKQNPEIEFEYSFADEDIAYNIGKYLIKNGEILDFCISEGSKEAFDLFFELHSQTKDYI